METIGYTPETPDLDAVFAALADSTRRAILSRLARGQASVTELSAPFNISQPAVSKHLKVLERAGLVERNVDQQRRPARLKAENMAFAVDWLLDFRPLWGTSFDQLDELLTQMTMDAAGDTSTSISTNTNTNTNTSTSTSTGTGTGSGTKTKTKTKTRNRNNQ